MPFNRYLVPFDPRQTPHLFTDVLVIGGGIAGLRAALEVPADLHVLVVTKDQLQQSNSTYAQGGIAGVLSPEDRFENHIEDTLIAGGRAVRPRTSSRWSSARRPQQIDDLIRLGHALRRGGRPARPDPRGRPQPPPHRPRPGRRHRPRGDAGHHRPRPPDAERHPLGRHLHARPADPRGPLRRGARLAAAAQGQLLVWAKQTILATGGARHGLPRDDQPAGRDRRRHGRRLPRRGRAARHGVHAVPPDGALRRRLEPRS